MGSQSDAGPTGARATSGVVSRRSPLPVAETVDRLATAIRAAGAKLFFVVDHSGEAQRVGMALRDTKLLVFGNPAGGTLAMVASPLAALDLPLKILVDGRRRRRLDELPRRWLAGCPPWPGHRACRTAVGGRPPHRPGRNLINSVDRAEAIAH